MNRAGRPRGVAASRLQVGTRLRLRRTEQSPAAAIATPAVAAVEITNVWKRFGSHDAVRGVQLDIHSGEFFSLLGPSGCGKSTTLRLIAGFEEPTSGSIAIGGIDMHGISPNRRPVNVVFQNYALFNHLNVFENVAFGLREARVRKTEIKQRVGAVLDLVQLTGYGSRATTELSGGEQQRVAVARALVLEPAVLLLDEPLAALDLKLRKSMQVELKELQKRVGITFLYVTHDQTEALGMSDRIAVMNQGKLEQIGSPRELYNEPATLFTASFVGEGCLFRGQVRDGVFQTEAGAALPVPPGAKGSGHLLVRPEAVRLQLTPAAPDNSLLAGGVEDVEYEGADCRVSVRLPDGLKIGARVRAAELAAACRPGQSVALSWEPSQSWLVPEATGLPASSPNVDAMP